MGKPILLLLACLLLVGCTGTLQVGTNSLGTGLVTLQGGNLASFASAVLPNTINLVSNATITTTAGALTLSGSITNSGGLTLVVQVLGTMVLARLLTPRDFGLVTMVTTFSLLFSNFGFNGLTEAIVQRASQAQFSLPAQVVTLEDHQQMLPVPTGYREQTIGGSKILDRLAVEAQGTGWHASTVVSQNLCRQSLQRSPQSDRWELTCI